jgi:dihydroflavonol-4-reductase
VTGGTGLIGRPLVEALLADGWDVAVLTRDPARAKDLETRGVHLVDGDVTRPRFNAPMARADVVFHVAGVYEVGLRDARRMIDVNVTGTGNVLAAARKQNVGRVVFTSTAGVFAPTPPERPATESSPVQTALEDPYVTSKVQAHGLAVAEMHAGLPLTIVLPGAVFGPGDTGQLGRTLALLAMGRLPRLPRGFGTVTWTHAADIAAGHVLAATRGKPGELYLLGDRVLPIVEFYAKAAEAAGVDAPKANVPMGLARLAARFSEANARFAGRTPVLSRAALAFATVDIVVDASKARGELGWNPAPFEDRIRETMAWYVDTYRVRGAPLPVKPDGAFAGDRARTA